MSALERWRLLSKKCGERRDSATMIFAFRNACGWNHQRTRVHAPVSIGIYCRGGTAAMPVTSQFIWLLARLHQSGAYDTVPFVGIALQIGNTHRREAKCWRPVPASK